MYVGFLGGASGKESACQCSRCKRCRFDPWVGKIHWRRKWQPTPVFLPGESHGQRSLAGYGQSMGSQTAGQNLETKQPPRPWLTQLSPFHAIVELTPVLCTMPMLAAHILLDCLFFWFVGVLCPGHESLVRYTYVHSKEATPVPLRVALFLS